MDVFFFLERSFSELIVFKTKAEETMSSFCSLLCYGSALGLFRLLGLKEVLCDLEAKGLSWKALSYYSKGYNNFYT